MDRDHKQRLLLLTAEMGKANGMRAGAEILRAIIQGRKRIDAAELRAAAAKMEDAAAKVDAKAKLEMVALGTAD
jgi:hypothetical protein